MVFEGGGWLQGVLSSTEGGKDEWLLCLWS